MSAMCRLRLEVLIGRDMGISLKNDLQDSLNKHQWFLARSQPRSLFERVPFRRGVLDNVVAHFQVASRWKLSHP
jgi:hypothetical protein